MASRQTSRQNGDMDWIPGPHGTESRTLRCGIRVTIGLSDAAYPPGTNVDGTWMNLNTTDLWLKLEHSESDTYPYPVPLGWWARLNKFSPTKTKEAIDDHDWFLPSDIWAEYLYHRVQELEGRLALLEREK